MNTFKLLANTGRLLDDSLSPLVNTFRLLADTLAILGYIVGVVPQNSGVNWFFGENLTAKGAKKKVELGWFGCE